MVVCLLQSVLDEFYSVFEWSEVEVSVPAVGMCEAVLEGEEKMEEIFGNICYCKHGEMEGELRERAVKDRSVIRSLIRSMRGRKV